MKNKFFYRLGIVIKDAGERAKNPLVVRIGLLVKEFLTWKSLFYFWLAIHWLVVIIKFFAGTDIHPITNVSAYLITFISFIYFLFEELTDD